MRRTTSGARGSVSTATRATESTLTFVDTWSQAAVPLLVVAAWTLLAVTLARRALRWEPRT